MGEDGEGWEDVVRVGGGGEWWAKVVRVVDVRMIVEYCIGTNFHLGYICKSELHCILL